MSLWNFILITLISIPMHICNWNIKSIPHAIIETRFPPTMREERFKNDFLKILLINYFACQVPLQYDNSTISWNTYELSGSVCTQYCVPIASAFLCCCRRRFSRCNISRLCYDVSVRLSVRLSVTEVHWRIIANLGFKFRSHFTAQSGRRAACGRHAARRAAWWRIISRHASQC